MEPVLQWHFLMGDGEIAGEPGFAGEEIIIMRVQPVRADIIANMKQAALTIIIRRKFHPIRVFFGLCSQPGNSFGQFGAILLACFHGISKRLEPRFLIFAIRLGLFDRKRCLVEMKIASRAQKQFDDLVVQFPKFGWCLVQQQPGRQHLNIVNHRLELVTKAVQPSMKFTKVLGGNGVRISRDIGDDFLKRRYPAFQNGGYSRMPV